MKNRYGMKLKRGLRVKCNHPRGGHETGVIDHFERISGYGWRIVLDTGFSASVDDVIEARNVIVMLKPMRHEVPAVRNGRPGYRWAQRYIVITPQGKEEYPPCTRNEALARARELGATEIIWKEG